MKRSTRSGPKSDGIFTLISYRFFSAFLSEFGGDPAVQDFRILHGFQHCATLVCDRYFHPLHIVGQEVVPLRVDVLQAEGGYPKIALVFVVASGQRQAAQEGCCKHEKSHSVHWLCRIYWCVFL